MAPSFTDAGADQKYVGCVLVSTIVCVPEGDPVANHALSFASTITSKVSNPSVV